MIKQEVQENVARLLHEKKGKIFSENLISAALNIFTNPAGTIEKLAFGVDKSIEDEKLKIQQNMILDLICDIASSLEKFESQFNQNLNLGKVIIVNGHIEVDDIGSDDVTGAHFKGSNTIEMEPGTKISVKSNGSKTVTGLKIEM